ncbi:MAG: hypothetical protein V4550_08995 [Gemmatimonadota bacterium]
MTYLPAIIAIALGAQLTHAQVPLVSIDLLAGVAAHSTSAGVYRSDPVPTVRLAGEVRLWSRGNTRPVLKVEVEPRPCCTGSTGAPGPYPFPRPGGVSYALGVSYLGNSGLVLGVAVGGGRYGGEYRGTRHNSVFGEAELGWNGLPHTAFMANVQYRQWSASGTRFWFAPTTVGVRVF